MKYIYLSLKRTHKNDDWFCFWRPNSAGYTMFVHDAGEYDTPYDGDTNPPSVKTIKLSEFEQHVITVHWAGKQIRVVPNREEVRRALGILPSDLHASHKYPVGPWKQLSGVPIKHKFKKEFPTDSVSYCEYCGIQRERVGPTEKGQYKYGPFGEQVLKDPGCNGSLIKDRTV